MNNPTQLRNRVISLALVFIALVVLVPPLFAQDQPDDPDPAAEVRAIGVYATTQDFSSLRRGPGTAFERWTVVPPAVTMPAIGRTANGRWVQVEYEGQRGWIASFLLVWSGDFVQLPIDGVEPEPFARRVGVLAVTTRETPIYARGVSSDDQVGTIPAGVELEVTAQLGTNRYRQVQVTYNGQFYWVGSWNLRFLTRAPLLDVSYTYAFGRLREQLFRNINSLQSRLDTIESFWLALGRGEAVSCNNLPDLFEVRQITQGDIEAASIFAPVNIAFTTAVDNVNGAITTLQDACGRVGEDFFVTQEEVRQSIADLESARRNLNLARSLLTSIVNRDPLLNPGAASDSAFR